MVNDLAQVFFILIAENVHLPNVELATQSSPLETVRWVASREFSSAQILLRWTEKQVVRLTSGKSTLVPANTHTHTQNYMKNSKSEGRESIYSCMPVHNQASSGCMCYVSEPTDTSGSPVRMSKSMRLLLWVMLFLIIKIVSFYGWLTVTFLTVKIKKQNPGDNYL